MKDVKRTLMIGGPMDGARVQERPERMNCNVVVTPELSRVQLQQNPLIGLSEMEKVYIYRRFDGRLYFQRCCLNRDLIPSLLGIFGRIEEVIMGSI